MPGCFGTVGVHAGCSASLSFAAHRLGASQDAPRRRELRGKKLPSLPCGRRPAATKAKGLGTCPKRREDKRGSKGRSGEVTSEGRRRPNQPRLLLEGKGFSP